MLILMLFVMALVNPLFALLVLLQAVAGVTVAQGIALTIAGIVAPFIAQVIKNWTGAGGAWAMLLACAVSAAIAIAASFIAGDVHSVSDVVKNAMAVFGVATVVFHLLIGPKSS